MKREEIKALAAEIADALNEKGNLQRRHIQGVIRICGQDFAHDLLRQALEVEDAGGMLTDKGHRRRTIGGVFFKLAKERTTDEQRRRIFPTVKERRERAKKASEKGQPRAEVRLNKNGKTKPYE